jgi:WD40 repeat protein
METQIAIVDYTNNGLLKVYNENLTLRASFKAHLDYINRIKQSPFNIKKNYVATCANDNTVKIWDSYNSSNWRLIQTYMNHTGSIYGLEYSNEDTIISGGFDQTIQIWVISTGRTIRKINTPASVYAIQILSSDGYDMAVGLTNSNISIYDMNTGNLKKTLQGHTDYVTDLVLISNNQTLASSSRDNTIRIWDLSTNTCQFVLQGHTAEVYGLKLISCSLLASGSWDDSVRLWDLNSGKELRKFTNHTGDIFSVDLLNDNEEVLVSGSIDRTIMLWNWKTGELLKKINTTLRIKGLAVLKRKQNSLSLKYNKTHHVTYMIKFF